MKHSILMAIQLLLTFHLSAQESVQTLLLESAEWAETTESLVVEDRSFAYDCSGVIYAVSYRSGLDIQQLIRDYPGNGVKRIFLLLEEKQAIFSSNPQIGDLIFWDNSYDKNGNGLRDDPLTHIGMVVQVDEDGLIHFIHYHYRLGVVRAYMDPNDPGNLERNSPMRAKGSSNNQDGWSAAHLLRAYGHLETLYSKED